MDSALMDFFGGVTWENRSSMPGVVVELWLYELVRWLLPIGICLMFTGAYLKKQREIERLSCYRYGSILVWWGRKFTRSLFAGLLAGEALVAAAIVYDAAMAVKLSAESVKIIVLWSVHIMTLVSFMLVLEQTRLKGISAIALLLLEGFTFMLGFEYSKIIPFMCGMWGMYLQSDWYDSQKTLCASSVIIAQGILILLSFMQGAAQERIKEK